MASAGVRTLYCESGAKSLVCSGSQVAKPHEADVLLHKYNSCC